jgi:hypothetical protein
VRRGGLNRPYMGLPASLIVRLFKEEIVETRQTRRNNEVCPFWALPISHIDGG